MGGIEDTKELDGEKFKLRQSTVVADICDSLQEFQGAGKREGIRYKKRKEAEQEKENDEARKNKVESHLGSSFTV